MSFQTRPRHPQDRKDRRRISGGDDRTEEEGGQRGEPEDQDRKPADEQSRQDDADGRKSDPLPEDRLDLLPPRVKPAREEDIGKGDDPDSLRKGRIVEGDTPRTFRTCEHPDDEENKESRDTEPLCKFVCDDTDKEEHRNTDKEEFEGEHNIWVWIRRGEP